LTNDKWGFPNPIFRFYEPCDGFCHLSFVIVTHLLRSLYIKNYALIEEFRVEFEPGLNIITGETGAGKSIVLGAFGLLMGDRASAEMVRTGTEKTIVEAEFDESNPALKQILEDHEIEAGPRLIVRREVSLKGSSRAFVNDSPVPAHVLNAIGEILVDLHGQHEHQSLLRVSEHIEMLDEYAGIEREAEAFRLLRNRIYALRKEIEEMNARKSRAAQDHDFFEFQLREITEVDPADGEDDQIEARLFVLQNAEDIRETASEILHNIYDDDDAVIGKLGAAERQFSKLAELDPSVQEPLSELKSAYVIITELSRWVRDYVSRVPDDAEEYSALNDRLQRIDRLKKKFGGTLAAVLEKKRELEAKLSFEEESEERIAEKENELSHLEPKAATMASLLSKARNAAGKKLEPQIVGILKELGIEHSRFEVQITEAPEFNSRGKDNVEFFISTNAGERPKQLVRVASGGEISRIMLALKTVLSKGDRLPLLVFDEIDTGISGRVAQRVGRAMKSLAAEHQTIAITHLAQIAACADTHYLAEKISSKGMTASRLRTLSEDEHIEAVARLISGDVLNKSAIANAQTLIAEAMHASRGAAKPKKIAAAA